MRVVLYTPTCRHGGLDIATASINRQQIAPSHSLKWIVGDDLLNERAWLYAPDSPHQPLNCSTFAFNPRILTHRKNSAVAAHNEALKLARALEADLFVFFLDYTWFPPDGVERWVRMAGEHPTSLMTGIAHTMHDPSVDEVTDPHGAYTIFKEPYTDRPRHLAWEDVRVERNVGGIEWQQIEPFRWEANWAALPKAVLMDERLNFDETYDDFHGHDNTDYAFRAGVLGYDCWIDYANVCYRLPRRTYWPEEDRFKDQEAAGQEYFWSHARGEDITDPDASLVGLYRNIAVTDPPSQPLSWYREHLQPFGKLTINGVNGDAHELQFGLMMAGFARVALDAENGATVASAHRGIE